MDVHAKASPDGRFHPQLHTFYKRILLLFGKKQAENDELSHFGETIEGGGRWPVVRPSMRIPNLSSRATSEARSRGNPMAASNPPILLCHAATFRNPAAIGVLRLRARPTRGPQRAPHLRAMGWRVAKEAGRKLFAVAPLRITTLRLLLKTLLLRNPDLCVGTLVNVHGFDKPDLAFVELHYQRRGARPVSKEAHALEQQTVGNSGCREDDVRARRQLVGGINTLGVADNHIFHAFGLLGRVADQTTDHVAIQ